MLPLIGLLCALSAVFAHRLEIVHEWTSLKFNTPHYYPKNVTVRTELLPIISVEVGFDRIFLAIAEISTESPASLVYISKHNAEMDPVLQAYPSWDWHVDGIEGAPNARFKCHGFLSVTRIRADRCGRLWALDSSYGYRGGHREITCPPKLVAFDLFSHQEVRRIQISKDVLTGNSNLLNFVIDDTDDSGSQPAGTCDVGHIYITDVSPTQGVIVVNLQTHEMWRHSDPAMWPQHDHARAMVAGELLIVRDGLVGAALSKPGPGKHRDFFFNALASKTIYSVNTASLKRRSNPIPELRQLPVHRVLEKPSQSLPICYDPVEDALLFSPLNGSSLIAYTRDDKKFHTISHDPRALQFVSEIQAAILDDYDIWVVSTKQHKVILGTVDPREINNRIFRLNRHPPKEFSIGNHQPVKIFKTSEIENLYQLGTVGGYGNEVKARW